MSLPLERATGELPTPSGFWGRMFADPDDYVLILNLTPMDTETGLRDISSAIRRAEDNALFVFIHGYNVGFEDAVRRTAQLSYDLDFPGAPLAFSWPSNGDLLGYNADQDDADWAAAHLAAFLLTAKEDLGAQRIHIVAHSMGNRVLTEALEDLQQSGVSLPLATHVVLTAPDIDADIFRRDVYPAIRGTTEQMTLYVSENDLALRAAKSVAGGYPRLGDPSDAIVVLEGLETIDASEIDVEGLGHSYFAETLEMVTDLFMMLKSGLSARERRLAEARTAAGDVYWRLRR